MNQPESTQAREIELPDGFVRLTYQDGQPAIVVRDTSGQLVTQVVASHQPYSRAIARAVAEQYRGVLDRLADHDQTPTAIERATS